MSLKKLKQLEKLRPAAWCWSEKKFSGSTVVELLPALESFQFTFYTMVSPGVIRLVISSIFE